MDVNLSPVPHVFVSDVLPSAIAYGCTFGVLHWTGYVGVMNCQNLTEIYVTKRTGGKIRTQHQHDIYELNQEDPDRIISGLTDDNKVRKSRRTRFSLRHVETIDKEDPDRILYL